MKRKFLLPFVFIAFLSSCGDDDNDVAPIEEEVIEISSIVATVKKDNAPVGEGVVVITDPFTEELITDAFGQVRFDSIQAGIYDVYAFSDYYGSGKATVELVDELKSIDVNIIEGVMIAPYVRIISPEFNQGYAGGEEIEFLAYVYDNISQLNNLIIGWESNIDGTLTGGSISDEGIATLKTSSLSNAEHYIKINVTNELGLTSSDSVLINTLSPESLKLSFTQDAKYNVQLSWSNQSNDADVVELYRSTGTYYSEELIATITDGQSSYTDYWVPFTDSVSYYAKAYNIDRYSSKSNVVKSAGTPYFAIQATQAEMLDGGDYIYLKAGSQITAIDYEQMAAVSTYSGDGTFGYFHVGDNGYGNELYIPNSDGWLYVYDLSSYELKQSINVGVPVTCVISDGKGLLYTSVSPSPWWEQPLRVYNRETGAYVAGGGDFDDTRLRLLPSGNEIIEISTSISPIDMDYYLFDDYGNFVLHKNDSYHGDYPLDPDIYKVAPYNNYLITSNKGAIYTADQYMKYVGSLPRGSEYYTDFEFNSTASVIYAGLRTKKAIYAYDYQTLSKTVEFPTKGYPVYLFRNDNRLIVVSSPDPVGSYYGPNKVGIEIIEL